MFLVLCNQLHFELALRPEVVLFLHTCSNSYLKVDTSKNQEHIRGLSGSSKHTDLEREGKCVTFNSNAAQANKT